MTALYLPLYLPRDGPRAPAALRGGRLVDVEHVVLVCVEYGVAALLIDGADVVGHVEASGTVCLPGDDGADVVAYAMSKPRRAPPRRAGWAVSGARRRRRRRRP